MHVTQYFSSYQSFDITNCLVKKIIQLVQYMSLGYINDRAIRWRIYSNFLRMTFYGNYNLRDFKASVIPDNGIVELSQDSGQDLRVRYSGYTCYGTVPCRYLLEWTNCLRDKIPFFLFFPFFLKFHRCLPPEKENR